MMRSCRFIVLSLCLMCIGGSVRLAAQNVPVPLAYTRIYDFLDELATDGIIQLDEAVRPYTRRQVAAMLVRAGEKDSLLNHRQREDLRFYLDEYALERDTMCSRYVQYTDHRTYNLSLADPQFSYMTKNKLFKMQVRPLLGMDVYASKKGAVFKRWYGAELQMDIAHHLSIWGSLRDQSYNGKWALSNKYYPGNTAKMYGARLQYGASQAQPALNTIPGVQYKEAEYGGDFSDSKGGISLYTWWGSVSLMREEIRWGDAYHSSNILSGRNPAVPQLALQLTPVWWLQFDYFHAWLVSNVLNEEDYYVEQTVDIETRSQIITTHQPRQRSKYMAANMLTFMPCKWVHFSLGNSIVYAEKNPQAAYFIPIAFYKSLDHLLTKGASSENQNSQVYFTLTARPVDHLKLYGSCFIDEVKWERAKPSSKEKNPVSYLVGFDWTGWPVRGLGLKGEFMRSYIACYTHSIDVIEYTSNGYPMGHYMGDNAQSVFVELSYRPLRGMWLGLSYTHDTKYNPYLYLRRDISNAISQKPFDKAVFTNQQLSLDFTYEVHPHMYLTAQLLYNKAIGHDNLIQTCTSEITGKAQDYLDRFCPRFYQGENLSARIGFSFGF